MTKEQLTDVLGVQDFVLEAEETGKAKCETWQYDFGKTSKYDPKRYGHTYLLKM